MVFGNSAYEAALAALSSGVFDRTSLSAGIASSATGIPFNIAQGVVGVMISVLLLPVLAKIPDISEWIEN